MFKAIRILFSFLYHFFFIDQATGTQSNTKFFANVGYIIWCYLFPWVVKHGSTAPMEIWLVFGAVIIGNRTLNVWMQNKAGVQGDPNSTWKGMMTNPVDGSGPPMMPPTQNIAPDSAPPPGPQMFQKVPDTSDLVDK